MTTNKNTLPNYKWIKFDLEYLNNPDFFQITDAAAGAFLKLYLLAGKADAGGLLCNSDKVFTQRDLAWFLRCSPDTINTYLEELKSAGFVAADGDGFMIPRFLEEQGPGDNDMREEWRKRQNKHRARARKEPEPEQKAEAEKEKATEGEVEEEVDIECHGDITVTTTPPAAANAAADKTTLELEARELARKTYQDTSEERITDVVSYALASREEKGWSRKTVLDFVVENIPPGELEARIKRGTRPAGWLFLAEAEEARHEAEEREILRGAMETRIGAPVDDIDDVGIYGLVWTDETIHTFTLHGKDICKQAEYEFQLKKAPFDEVVERMIQTYPEGYAARKYPEVRERLLGERLPEPAGAADSGWRPVESNNNGGKPKRNAGKSNLLEGKY